MPGFYVDAVYDHSKPRPRYPTRFGFQQGDRQFLKKVLPVIDSYAEAARQKCQVGWSAHLIRTRMHHLVWFASEIPVKVHAPARHLFSKLSGQLRARSMHGNTPILIGCADDYVAITMGQRSREPFSLRGLFNGLLLVPPDTRLKGTVETHVARNDFLYRRDGISDLDVQSVDPASLPRACRQVFRGVLNGDISMEKGPLILPKVLSGLGR
ncbi:hypothetical protein ACRAWG_00370 [Methylobacterium sp. P31]